jgi:hypothetical protein
VDKKNNKILDSGGQSQMPINFEAIMNELFSKGLVIAGVVSRSNGQIVYISSNWSVDPADLQQCITKWQSRGQFTMLQNIKYSLLMNTAEYFSGVNYKDKTWLCGAASLDPNDRYYVIGFAPAGVDGKSAYVDTTRAANQMREGGAYIAPDKALGKFSATDVAAGAKTGAAAATTAAPAAATVDPNLKAEIDGFIQWLKDPNGLAGYIQYYLNQNDPNVLAKLAKAYNDFRQVFGF